MKQNFFIESVDGVMSFVGPKGSPQPVTEVEMSRYLVSSDGDELSVMILMIFHLKLEIL